MLIRVVLAAAALASVLSAEVARFQDVNLLIVTDAHSWISGHAHDDHDPVLNADYGAIASAALRLKEAAASEGKDVFFVNNGDHVEGSGLSDASVYTVGVGSAMVVVDNLPRF